MISENLLSQGSIVSDKTLTNMTQPELCMVLIRSSENEALLLEFNDAHAALRGYAPKDLSLSFSL